MSSLREQHEALEAEMAAVRQRASEAGRPLNADEIELLNDLSIQRASVYRAWQQERLRTEPSTIITGEEIFRQAARKRQWRRWGAVIIVVVILGVVRFERYNDRQSATAGDIPFRAPSYSSPVITDRQQALFDLLPSADALPEGFETGGEWVDTLDDLGWDEDYRLQLISWGFKDSVYRYYVIPDDLKISGVDSLYDLDVQLTEFGSRDQAIDATRADWMDTKRIAEPGSSTTFEEDPSFGDLTAAVSEPYVSYGVKLNWVTFWVVDGPLQYRFWAVTDDTAVAPAALVEIAQATLARD